MTDQTPISKDTLEKTLLIDAPPDRVWAFLTKAEHLAKWFHAARDDLKPGDAYALLGDDGSALCTGEVLEAREPEHLKMTFTARPMNGLMTVVTFSLTPVGRGTRLHLRHEGLSTAGDAIGLAIAFDTGWDKHFVRLRETI
ncbi:MAG: SRPBCC domain-containing protein [Pseudomonadota bacterium]